MSCPSLAAIRSEEFVNAFDYRDPEPGPNQPVAFAWERAAVSVRSGPRRGAVLDQDSSYWQASGAAAKSRPGSGPIRLDGTGGSVRIVQEALRVLAGQLQPQDRISVVTFARTARLLADGVAGSAAGPVLEQVANVPAEGGTNRKKLALGNRPALRRFASGGINRVVLLTDGAANLGNVNAGRWNECQAQPTGCSLDCFGIGWEGSRMTS